MLRSEPVERPADQIVELEDVALRAQRAGLDPAQVEQVGDQPVEVFDLALDRVGALLPVVVAQLARRAERAGRRPDRRQWRAQVVRDGLQQRGLERVALASDLGRSAIRPPGRRGREPGRV